MAWFTDNLRSRATLLEVQANTDEALGIQPKDTQFFRDTAVMARQAAFHLDVAPHAPGCAWWSHGGALAESCTCWKKELQ